MQPTALLPVRTAAPGARILSNAEAKKHLNVDFSDDDDYIASLVLAAEAHLDGFAGVLGRALITQTWKRSFDAFPDGDVIRLPLGPLLSVSTVMYYDQSGSNLAFGASSYHAISDAIGPCVKLADTAVWPNTAERPDAVTVTWVCGYGAAASDVPAPIVHAAKLIVGHLYANREAVGAAGLSGLPMAVDALIQPYRLSHN